MQALDFNAHLGAKLGIEIRQRLIEQEGRRIAHHGAADGDALALATGQRCRATVEIGFQPQRLAGFLNALVLLGFRQLRRVEPETDVLAHGHMRIDRIVLEHHGDVALFGVTFIDDFTADLEMTARNILKPCNHAQGGGLATA